MEIQLQELIEQIKKDGVEVAGAQSREIIDKAKTDAERIIADAKEEANKILTNAKIENERMVKSSEEAIRQAGRNLLISFRESVAREIRAILKENVTSLYSATSLVNLIEKAVEGWVAKPDAKDISFILNTSDLELIEKAVLDCIKNKMIKGVTLKASDNFDGGFRISVNDESVYYDYSTESVVDMLSNYLTPKVIKLLKEAE